MLLLVELLQLPLSRVLGLDQLLLPLPLQRLEDGLLARALQLQLALLVVLLDLLLSLRVALRVVDLNGCLGRRALRYLGEKF